MRDKTFAHIDDDGPVESEGLFNKTRIHVRDGDIGTGFNFFGLPPERIAEAEQLLDELVQKCRSEWMSIWKRYTDENHPPNGLYEIPLGDDESPLIRTCPQDGA